MNEIERRSLEYMQRAQVCEVRKTCKNPDCLFDSEGMKRQRDGRLKCPCGWIQRDEELEIRIVAVMDKHRHRDNLTGGES